MTEIDTSKGAIMALMTLESDAVARAERIVGRPDDEYGALLNPVLDARTWEGHR